MSINKLKCHCTQCNCTQCHCTQCHCTQPDWYIGQTVDDYNGYTRHVTNILWPTRKCSRCGATDVKYLLCTVIYTGYEWNTRHIPYCIHCNGNCDKDYPSW